MSSVEYIIQRVDNGWVCVGVGGCVLKSSVC